MRNKTRFEVFLMAFAMVMLCSTLAFAAENASAVNSVKPRMWTVLSPLVSIVLALLTKSVVVSLFIGTMTGYIMSQLNGPNIITALTQGFINFTYRALSSLANPWDAGIILQVLVIGGVIHLVAKIGGAKAIAEALTKKAKTVKNAQLITWLLGLAVFSDDYVNSLIVGPIMRPVTDKLGVSKEKLVPVIDATAAPITGLAIISTWIGLEVGLIGDALKGVGIQADGLGVSLETIPYRFHNILILAFVVISAITLGELGPMLKAGRRARRKEVLSATKIPSDGEDLESIEGIKSSAWNAIILVEALVVSSLIGFYYSGWVTIMGGEDLVTIRLMNDISFSFAGMQTAFSNADASVALLQPASLATIVALILGFPRKVLAISGGIGIWIEGMKGLLITGVILMLAWSLSPVTKELGTASYLVGVLSSAIPAFLLPAIIFILGSIIALATGATYGTMGTLMPPATPLAFVINPEWNFAIVSTSVVLAGATSGDHCSPISDTTILSSTGAGYDHIGHVRTQIWYVVFVGIITVLFGYTPAGLGLSIFVVLSLPLVALFTLTMMPGKKVDDKVVSN